MSKLPKLHYPDCRGCFWLIQAMMYCGHPEHTARAVKNCPDKIECGPNEWPVGERKVKINVDRQRR